MNTVSAFMDLVMGVADVVTQVFPIFMKPPLLYFVALYFLFIGIRIAQNMIFTSKVEAKKAFVKQTGAKYGAGYLKEQLRYERYQYDKRYRSNMNRKSAARNKK